MEPLGEALPEESIENENRMEEPDTSMREESENLSGEEEEEDEDEPECRVCRGPAEEG